MGMDGAGLRMPVCINCICHSCNNRWKSEEWTGKCPLCGSENISQNVAIDMDKVILVKETGYGR